MRPSAATPPAPPTSSHQHAPQPAPTPLRDRLRALRGQLVAGVAGLVVAAGIAPVGAARATVIVPHSLASLTQDAARVVRARVGAQWSDWGGDRRQIFTWTELEVLETWVGDASDDALVVRTLGGAVGDIGMRVSGSPEFQAGAEVVVFLRVSEREPGAFEVVGMSQGKFDVHGDRAVPDLRGLALADPRGRPGFEPLVAMDVATLAARVRAHAGVEARPLAPPSAPNAPPVPRAPDVPTSPSTPPIPGTEAPGRDADEVP